MTASILGDITGSRFEFDGHGKKDLELFERDPFTDETVMTVAFSKALPECGYDGRFFGGFLLDRTHINV